MAIKLSPSSLNFFLDCPLCFWLAKNKGIEPPGGPMPTITNGIDRVIKEYMNHYRPHGRIPPFLVGKVPGRLIEFMPSALKAEIGGNILNGRLDECLVLDNGEHAALDHKTKGFAPKEDHQVHEAYQLQMDCYTLLLEKNSHKTGGTGYIVYYYPDFGELHNGIPFKVSAHKLKTDTDRALKVFRDAVKCLQGDEPMSSEDCGLCEYVRERK